MDTPITDPKPMKIHTTTAGPLLILLCLSVGGCFSLSRGAPAQKHYVLGGGDTTDVVPPGPQPAVETGAAAMGVVGLRPPDVADYLANAYIVVRRGIHRVSFSEFDRWGEDLARGVTRTLAGQLAARSPTRRVETAPWPVSVRPDLLVEVRLLRFEGVAPEDPLAVAGEAHLLATWEILDAGGGGRVAAGETDVRSDWTVGDFDALVGLLDDALDVLAEDLARGMESIPPSPEAAPRAAPETMPGTPHPP